MLYLQQLAQTPGPHGPSQEMTIFECRNEALICTPWYFYGYARRAVSHGKQGKRLKLC